MKKAIVLIQYSTIVFIYLLFFSFGLNSCLTSKGMSTATIPVVKNFKLERYLGTWYEIARLPNSFEKNLDYVTATYTLRDDGKIKVLNKGFNAEKNSWKEVTGKAWIPDSRIPARLRVSFFWIFSSDYKIIALDTENYLYSMVTSNTKKYLWILCRTPEMDAGVYTKLVEKAYNYGFEVYKLYKVDQ